MDYLFWLFSYGLKTWTVPIGLALLLIWLVWKGGTWRAAALLAPAGVGVTNLCADLFKNLISGARPCVALPDVVVLSSKFPLLANGEVGRALTSQGTVSAHAANMACVCAVFWFLLGRKWGIAWAIVAFLTGLSRIYVGVHFPSQVLFGWMLGGAIGCLVAFVYRRVVAQRTD